MLMSSRRFRVFGVRSIYGCIGVLLLLLASRIHNPPSVNKYKRHQKKNDACSRMDYFKEDLLLSGYLVRNTNNLMYYCDVPKCGSSFMTLFLNDTFSCEDCYVKRVRMPPERKNYAHTKTMLQTSTYSFTFVREPYSRLFAAYLNKLYCPNELWLKLGIQVVKSVRKNASPLSKRYGHDVTFTEMAKFIINSVKHGVYLNIHLAPMYTRCDPCQTDFHFIGKLENMTSNLKRLVEDWERYGVKVDLEKDVNLKEIDYKSKRDLGPVVHLFTMLSACPDLPRYMLFTRLWSSYQMRGLILNDCKMPFKEHLVDSIDRIMYELAVEAAMEKSMDNKTALRKQREDALLEAYRALPGEYLYGLREVYGLDFALFDYDDSPPKLFDRSQDSL